MREALIILGTLLVCAGMGVVVGWLQTRGK